MKDGERNFGYFGYDLGLIDLCGYASISNTAGLVAGWNDFRRICWLECVRFLVDGKRSAFVCVASLRGRDPFQAVSNFEMEVFGGNFQAKLFPEGMLWIEGGVGGSEWLSFQFWDVSLSPRSHLPWSIAFV